MRALHVLPAASGAFRQFILRKRQRQVVRQNLARLNERRFGFTVLSSSLDGVSLLQHADPKLLLVLPHGLITPLDLVIRRRAEAQHGIYGICAASSDGKMRTHPIRDKGVQKSVSAELRALVPLALPL